MSIAIFKFGGDCNEPAKENEIEWPKMWENYMIVVSRIQETKVFQRGKRN